MNTNTDTAIKANPGPLAGSVSTAPPRTKLKGRMGILALLFTVMAFNAPLASVVSSVPVPIAFGNGAGAPLTAVFGAAIMAFFAVG
ncbi:hypothetical protein ACIPYV_16395, partial [Paenarthrobacter nicotinovorans]